MAVIGAGILGLATAREVLRRRPGARLVLLEKESGPGRHQTSHNSGVIHAGLYYKPGSAKALLCRAGAEMLTAYCDEQGIPYQRCGKLVVAVTESELPQLAELERRGLENGLSGLRVVSPDEISEIEPHVRALRGIHVPETGIVDYAQVAAALLRDVRALGADVRFGARVTGIRDGADAVTIDTSSGSVEVERVVSCAGLYSDRIARLLGAAPYPRIVPFRGDYYLLRQDRRDLVRGLVYPVPDPRFPFLGVHFTRRIDGAVMLGPNAVLAFGREGYGRGDVHPGELLETLTSRGFRRLAARYWRTGVAEMVRDYWKPAFLAELRRYMPGLRAEDLSGWHSGVRAQAVGEDGSLLDDFAFDVIGRFVNVRNAPSPAATSSLAIAKEIVDRSEGAT